MSVRGKSNADGSFDWKNAVLDASILAGSTFCAALLGLGAAGLLTDPKTAILGAAISAASQFFFVLSVKRGLVKQGVGAESVGTPKNVP